MPGFSNDIERVAVSSLPRGSQDDDIVATVRQVAEAATDFSWLSRGDTVLIKPASNSAKQYPATTSPLAVRAMVRLLKEKGAGRVILAEKPGVQTVYQDREGQRGSSRETLVHNGLHLAAVESGAQVHYFEEAGYDAYFEDHTQHPSHWKGKLILPNILNLADHLVLLPRVSRHVLAGTTLGLKAAVGWLRDDSRLELHRDARSFLQKIAEINDARVLQKKLRLILSVATKVQTTFGPDNGYVAEPDPGLIFASDSLIAHDMGALGWLLWNREYTTPRKRLSWYRDPYRSFPGLFNRFFLWSIWGFHQFIRSETYTNIPIQSVRTDPVLSHAVAIWGGVPRLEIEDVNGHLPEDIHTYITDRATT